MTGDIKSGLKRPAQVRLTDDIEPSSAMLDYCLKEHKRNDPRHKTLEDYYWNETAVQHRLLSDPEKPNNRVSHAFAKYITRIATAHFMGNGILYRAEDEAYLCALKGQLDALKNDIKVFEEAKEMSKHGLSFELLWIDPGGKLRTQAYGAGEIIPVMSQSPGNFLAMALRPYKITAFDGRRAALEYVDVYTAQYTYIYEKRGGVWVLLEKFSHNFSDVPVIVRMNNAELCGDYEDVIPQIDAYDKAVSDTANDLDYFSDAYLVMAGIDDMVGEDENGNELSAEQTGKIMKNDRLIYLPKDSKGYFITKDTSDVVSENHKKRVFKDIFFLSQVPNLTDEEFAGNLSGVAIKYKLFGLEELTIEKQTYFTSSELKKVRLITEYLNALHNTKYDWKTVFIKWDRAALENGYEIAQTIQLLHGIMSDERLIGMFPGVENAAQELQKRLQEQINAENSGFDPAPILELTSEILQDAAFAKKFPELSKMAQELQASLNKESAEVF